MSKNKEGKINKTNYKAKYRTHKDKQYLYTIFDNYEGDLDTFMKKYVKNADWNYFKKDLKNEEDIDNYVKFIDSRRFSSNLSDNIGSRIGFSVLDWLIFTTFIMLWGILGTFLTKEIFKQNDFKHYNLYNKNNPLNWENIYNNSFLSLLDKKLNPNLYEFFKQIHENVVVFPLYLLVQGINFFYKMFSNSPKMNRFNFNIKPEQKSTHLFHFMIIYLMPIVFGLSSIGILLTNVFGIFSLGWLQGLLKFMTDKTSTFLSPSMLSWGGILPFSWLVPGITIALFHLVSYVWIGSFAQFFAVFTILGLLLHTLYRFFNNFANSMSTFKDVLKPYTLPLISLWSLLLATFINAYVHNKIVNPAVIYGILSCSIILPIISYLNSN